MHDAGSAAGTGRSSNTKGILAEREAYTATSDESAEVVAVELVEGLRGIYHVFELSYS